MCVEGPAACRDARSIGPSRQLWSGGARPAKGGCASSTTCRGVGAEGVWRRGLKHFKATVSHSSVPMLWYLLAVGEADDHSQTLCRARLRVWVLCASNQAGSNIIISYQQRKEAVRVWIVQEWSQQTYTLSPQEPVGLGALQLPKPHTSQTICFNNTFLEIRRPGRPTRSEQNRLCPRLLPLFLLP